VKSLRASAVVLKRTPEQDAAWVRQVEAAKGRLRQRQGAVDATVVAGPDPAVEGSEPTEMVAPGAIEAGPRSLAMAEAAVEVMTARIGSASGQETAPATGSRPQQDPSVQPAGTVEGGAVEPLTGAPEEEAPAPGAPTVEAWVPEPSLVEAPTPEAPAVEGPVPLGVRAPMTVDLTLDNTPLDKGKQVMGVEGARPRIRPVPRRPLERRELRARPVLPWDRETPRPGRRRHGPTSPRWR
jgi:hypothetical protein